MNLAETLRLECLCEGISPDLPVQCSVEAFNKVVIVERFLQNFDCARCKSFLSKALGKKKP